MLINKYNIIEPNSQFLWIQVLYLCSETLERCTDQRGRDYHRSPRRSRSISQDRAVRDDYRSPSQPRSMSRDRGAKDHHRSPRRSRSVSRSLSPRSPHGEREYRTKQRSQGE
ncbi:uncharacterized protein LOC120150009 [Hibiscus syriacus]|uniref:uncharacterized protein LOC120150009 n=1 Tax=Hibiscus syriacus TaxID=106335 RepID=UPI0019230E54|nr:uncharacterized protein LOC120150009 [Hibiscus syriacus]